ncbi:MAG: hypothetical protein KDB80_07955, partial [Planctomycetes bacterium]|nr:hypothetical protein [Planctomycetota bacterium]
MKSATTRYGATLRRSALGSALLLSALLGLSACSSGGGSSGAVIVDPNSDEPAPNNTGDATLLQVQFGRLVDVYGFRRTDEGLALDLFRADVVIGPDIEDERPTGSILRDDEIGYDFLAADPDTLSPRLLIPREIGSDQFNLLFSRLSESNRNITASKFGQDVATRPFTVVPRNSALKLTFSQSLPVADDFFVVRDANGEVQAVRNTEAIQLLSIQSNPNDANDAGDFVVLPSRIIPRGNTLIIDPVFLGVEGVQYGTRNNASGMPSSGDQVGANIRLAIALDGPLKMPGVTLAADSIYRGKNNDGFDSIIRDFRSGNVEDESPDISRGFIRDSEPPRVVGSIPMLLEAVETVDPTTQIITVFKNNRSHEIDRGDIVRIVDEDGAVLISEVIEEPADDDGRPSVQHVRVPIRLVDGLSEIDPQLQDDYPTNPQNAAGERWLRREAPRVVLVSEYSGLRDDPANFLTFSPEPFAQVEGYDPFPGEPSLPNVNISPFAGAIVRFSKPVDLQSVKAFDTFFFSTRNVLDEVGQAQFKAEHGLSDQQFTLAKYMTPHLVDARVFDETGSQTVLRLQPVKGFFLNEEMRSVPPQDVVQLPIGDSQSVEGTDADPHEGLETSGLTAGAVATSKLPYFLQLVGGLSGIRDLAGNPVDFQDFGTQEYVSIPFYLDGRKFADGRPFFEDNLVVSIVRRYAASDEDEQPSLYLWSDADEYEFAMPDVFGAVSNTADGRLISRPATRVTKV